MDWLVAHVMILVAAAAIAAAGLLSPRLFFGSPNPHGETSKRPRDSALQDLDRSWETEEKFVTQLTQRFAKE